MFKWFWTIFSLGAPLLWRVSILNDFYIYKSFGDLVEQDVVKIFGIFARKLSIEDRDSVKVREVWNVVMPLKGNRSGTFVRQAMNVI